MSARKPPYPKLWNGPNPIGESQIRYMDAVGLPYMTKSGPGFMARKKGPFVEVTGTTDVMPTVASIRCAEYFAPTPTTSPSSNSSMNAADGSIKLVRKTTGTTATTKTVRGVDATVPLSNWISADEKDVVSWVAPRRYFRHTDLQNLVSGSDSNIISQPNQQHGVFGNTILPGFLTRSRVLTTNVWVNGRKYNAGVPVLGACIFRDQLPDGGEKKYLKVLAVDDLMLQGTQQTSVANANRAIIIDLASGATVASFLGLRADLAALWSAHGAVPGTQAAAMFNASGTEAVLQSVGNSGGVPFLMWSGLTRPTWRREVWPYFAEPTSSGGGLQTAGDIHSGTSSNAWSTTSSVLHAVDYLKGTDTVAYCYSAYSSSVTEGSTWSLVSGSGSTTTEAGTYSHSVTGTTDIKINASTLKSVSSSTSLERQTTWTYSAGTTISSDTSETTTYTDGVNAVVALDVRIGLVAVGLYSAVLTALSVPARPDNYFNSQFTSVGHIAAIYPGNHAATLKATCHALLESGGGGFSQTFIGSAEVEVSNVQLMRSVMAESALDVRGGQIAVSAYVYGAYLGTGPSTNWLPYSKLFPLGMWVLGRTNTGTPESPAFTYAPIATGLPNDRVYKGLTAVCSQVEGKV